jgi:RNA polymerase sigma-70 factor (ECF subfamily)
MRPSENQMTFESVMRREAAAALWSEFSAPLRAFLGKRVPSGVDADDIVQEVFVRIQERLPELRDTERIDAWIFQIARNVLADAFRARRRRELFASRAIHEAEAQPDLDDDRSAAAELATCMVPMVARLADPYRNAIELTELGGMTQIDAARRAGMSISGMKSRVQRGREQLERMLLECCHIELDVRGGVMDCARRDGTGCGDPLRPSACSNDSMDMSNTNASRTTQTQTTSSDTPGEKASGCCGGAAPADASACCALDAEVKATGGTGCGCGSKRSTTTKKGCC